MRGMSGGFNKESFQIPAACISQPRFALDIGGSLAKLAYVKTDDEAGDGRHDTLTVHLVTFQVDDLDSCLTFVKEQLSNDEHLFQGQATGVGCIKFKQKIRDALGLDLISDSMEMVHATRGLGVLWRHLPREQLVNEGSTSGDLGFQVEIEESGLLPCLLVNVGSAMTIVKVDRKGNMKNIVGGSTLAGLSLLGLGALLTNATSFPELVEMASRGDNANVDLLVRDTAGENYNNVPPEGMVSSFGRAARARANGRSVDFAQEDLANSLVKAITSNLAATTFYVARSENMKYICFCGSFIGGSSLMTEVILKQLKDASMILQHEVSPLFLRLEAYLGAVGVLLASPDLDKDTNGDLG